MRESYVGHDAVSEEGRFARPGAGAIKELSGNHHVERRILLLQRTHGRRREDPLNPEQFHAVNIRSKWNFAGRESMSATVTGKKGNAFAFQSADNKFVGRLAKRSVELNLVNSVSSGI
jgi:hypothetical protein